MTIAADRRALQLSASDLDRLSEVTSADVAAARAWWQRHADGLFRELLDAKTRDDAEPPSGQNANA